MELEQKQLLHELLDFSIECKEVGFNLWFEFVPHVNWVEVRACNKRWEELYSKIVSFERNELTPEIVNQIKLEVTALINEVPNQVITDKTQNVGC